MKGEGKGERNDENPGGRREGGEKRVADATRRTSEASPFVLHAPAETKLLSDKRRSYDRGDRELSLSLSLSLSRVGKEIASQCNGNHARLAV